MDTSSCKTMWLAHISSDKTDVQTVAEHLRGTAALAEQFARPFGGADQARLAGLLHDIGKYSPEFQKRLKGGEKVDHSTAGAQAAFALRQLEIAFAVAGHHGGLPDGGAQGDDALSGTLLGRLKKEVLREDKVKLSLGDVLTALSICAATNPIAEKAMEAVRSGKIVFTPKRYENTYFLWMENIRDWCISRQIWWGHRIPVYTCQDCGHEWAAPSAPAACPKCGAAADRVDQDPDVLDTWFSSWLWPFSTLGWPERTEDLQRYYPTADLCTAPDIIFFWVARMIMAGCRFMDEVPFRNVVFHGVVRDDKGRKMSKSLGNSIDPLEVIRKYSADALRFTLMQTTSPGIDVFISMDKFEIGRNFGTKIWNAARFILMHAEKCPEVDFHAAATAAAPALDPALLSDSDRHILATADAALAATDTALKAYRFQDAALAVYDFVWSQFCDWYLEDAKRNLYGDNPALRTQTVRILADVFGRALRMIHPFMPFVTEEIWSQMHYAGSEGDTISHAPWPQAYPAGSREAWQLTEAVRTFVNNRHALITAGRALRTNSNVPPSAKPEFSVSLKSAADAERLSADVDALVTALNASKVTILHDAHLSGIPTADTPLGVIGLHLADVVDTAAERQKVTEEIAKLQGFLKTVESKLTNERFLEKAPPAIVNQQKARKAELLADIARKTKLLQSLGGAADAASSAARP